MVKRKLHHFIFKAIERSKPFLLEDNICMILISKVNRNY